MYLYIINLRKKERERERERERESQPHLTVICTRTYKRKLTFHWLMW